MGPLARRTLLPPLVLLVAAGAAVAGLRARREVETSAAVPLGGGAGVDPRGATIAARFLPPPGFARVDAGAASFAAFLRALPLLSDGAPVRLFDGTCKRRQDVHAAVLALDVGARDLQQCADSVIRLRAEHLFAAGRADEIAFHFTSGFPCAFARWAAGERPRVDGDVVAWASGARPDASRAALRAYLDAVYTYAGTRSLPLDLVRAAGPVEPGDVYLRPGSPGHAMIVVDAAARGDERAILLAQGFMPAQQMHVVRNLEAPHESPWYVVGRGARVMTPEWACDWGDRYRFPASR